MRDSTTVRKVRSWQQTQAENRKALLCVLAMLQEIQEAAPEY
jgi:hypothetical protein